MDSVQLHRLLANGKVLCFKRCRERALGVKRGIYYGRDKKKKEEEEKYHRENGVAPWVEYETRNRGNSRVSYSLANLGPHCSVLIEGEYHGR